MARGQRERDPENENDVFPLTDPRVAVAINRINAGLLSGRPQQCKRVATRVTSPRRSRRQEEKDRVRQRTTTSANSAKQEASLSPISYSILMTLTCMKQIIVAK